MVNGIGIEFDQLLEVIASDTYYGSRVTINRSNFDNDCARRLSDALRSNTRIEQLEITATRQLGVEGVEHIANMLKVNDSIQELHIHDTTMDDEMVAALAEALPKNRNLKKIRLSNNNIGCAGTKALAKALESNENVKSLNLISNPLNDDAFSALGNMLRVNSTIEQIFLESAKSVTAQGVFALAHGIANHPAMLNFSLPSSVIKDENSEQLTDILVNSWLPNMVMGPSISDRFHEFKLERLKETTELAKRYKYDGPESFSPRDLFSL